MANSKCKSTERSGISGGGAKQGGGLGVTAMGRLRAAFLERVQSFVDRV
jgi:hypothetical protein